MSAMPTEHDSMTIGEVLSELAADFDEVSISKIRFLEGQGLIKPQRAPSGYRRFSREDVEQLRLVLLAQRDRYMPLKVIKERLADGTLREALGLAVPVAEPDPTRPEPEPEVEIFLEREEIDADAWFSARELGRLSGLTPDLVESMAKARIIAPDAAGKYCGADVLVCRVFVRLAGSGFDERHLKQLSMASERTAHVVSQLHLHLQGSERAAAQDAMARGLTEVFYWQMVARQICEPPTSTYRPGRQSAR